MSKKGNTIEDLADVLQTTYPEQRGFSSRSITEKRFCREKGIKRRGIVSNVQLDDAVRDIRPYSKSSLTLNEWRVQSELRSLECHCCF